MAWSDTKMQTLQADRESVCQLAPFSIHHPPFVIKSAGSLNSTEAKWQVERINPTWYDMIKMSLRDRMWPHTTPHDRLHSAVHYVRYCRVKCLSRTHTTAHPIAAPSICFIVHASDCFRVNRESRVYLAGLRGDCGTAMAAAQNGKRE